MDKKRELFEVKDDEEQRSKLVDICDLLLAAGYFRVRLKGLSAFDKVVGGMVWCLELCAVEVDVNFLFRENLNIGEKIEITEKIINVLLAMKCVYALEPHQIQGLDTVKIFPVVQWLVKRAMETRESLNKHLNSIAALHYNKSFTPTVQEEKLEQTARNLSKLYQAPIRQFKKVTDPEKPLSPYQQVVATLMEYGQSADLTDDPSLETVANLAGKAEAVVTEKRLESRAIAHRVSSLIHQQSQLISKSMDDYTQRQPERKGEKDEVALLEQSQKSVSQALDRVVNRIASQENVMQELKNKLTQLLLAEQDLADKKKSFAQLETPENQQTLKEMDDLIRRNELLNAERKEFKSRCKTELDQLESRNRQLSDDGDVTSRGDGQDEERLLMQLESVREQLLGAKKSLGEKNISVMRLRRQLDSIPGNAELNQYQRRFTELCLQVSEKQTELNGYYLLFNSLEDTKVYLDKEHSLLSSIHDKFSQSMQTNAGRTEFLQQMEKIVSAVRQNKTKIEKQIEMLKEKQQDLAACLNQLASEEHNYRDTLKSISCESQKYKQLTTSASLN